MSSPINDGGPAFPFGVRVDHHDTYGGGHTIEERNEPGMTLRDWFAGQALGSPASIYMADSPNCTAEQRTAIRCYRIADAMLAARERKVPKP